MPLPTEQKSLQIAAKVLPFEQQPKESDKAFEAFNLYLNLGASRSLEVVGQKLGKSKTLMERWSRQHNWVARVEAHAEHFAAMSRGAELEVVREYALEKAKRENAQKESEWQTRCEALALARECIARFKDNIRKTGTLEGIARLLELASKLGRLSCDMATDKTEKTVDEVHTLSVEFRAAIEKVYGQPVPPKFVAAPRAIEVESEVSGAGCQSSGEKAEGE